MNREQAEATVAKFLHSHGLVSALVALGLLKLDTPESVHQEGVNFIATMTTLSGWQRPDQVWAFRRGEPLKGPAPDPYKDWDGGADLPSGTSPYKKMAAGTSLADFKIVEGSPLEPIGGQNDRGAKGV